MFYGLNCCRPVLIIFRRLISSGYGRYSKYSIFPKHNALITKQAYMQVMISGNIIKKQEYVMQKLIECFHTISSAGQMGPNHMSVWF